MVLPRFGRYIIFIQGFTAVLMLQKVRLPNFSYYSLHPKMILSHLDY